MADGVELTSVTENGQPADSSSRAIEHAPPQISRDPTIITKTNATDPPGLCALMTLCFCPMSDTEPEKVKSVFRTPKKEENLPDAVPGNEAQENLGSRSSSPTIRTKNAFICSTVSVVVLFVLSSLALTV